MPPNGHANGNRNANSRLAKSHWISPAVSSATLTPVSQLPQSAVKKPAQSRPSEPVKGAEGTETARRAGRQSTAYPSGNWPPAYLACFLSFLRAAGFPVLLDRRLRQVLVLRADHSENRSRAVAATRNRAKLNRTFAPFADDDSAAEYVTGRVHRVRSTPLRARATRLPTRSSMTTCPRTVERLPEDRNVWPSCSPCMAGAE